MLIVHARIAPRTSVAEPALTELITWLRVDLLIHARHPNSTVRFAQGSPWRSLCNLRNIFLHNRKCDVRQPDRGRLKKKRKKKDMAIYFGSNLWNHESIIYRSHRKMKQQQHFLIFLSWPQLGGDTLCIVLPGSCLHYFFFFSGSKVVCWSEVTG